MTYIRAAELLSEVTVLDDPEMAEAHRVAISVLRQQEHFRDLTKKVEPLTLDELREAAETGDPVWLVIDRIGGWVVIEKVCYESNYQYVDYAEFGSDEPFYFEISEYGGKMKAYRQKPEEGTV